MSFLRKITPYFLVSFYHYCLALLGAVVFCFPSRKLFVIGVTGTSGKSTVVDLSAKVLEAAGYKVSALSSIKLKIGNREKENKLKMTMPGRFALQNFLRKAARAGCHYVVLEVTSEGIKQHRHRFIRFKAAIFTNLTPEHIEAHSGFENYRKEKLKLFKTAKIVHIVNLDDQNSSYFLQYPAKEKIGYLMEGASPLPKDSRIRVVRADNVSIFSDFSRFFVNNYEFKIRLPGRFNIYNVLASLCLGISQKVPIEKCKEALEKIQGIPGRMEIVIKEPFAVVVDYAHTPAALEAVLLAAKNLFSGNSPLICVLGACGGGRDKWKRPVLGKLARKYCQEVIVTNEDPYNEDPMEIINQVAEGAGNKAQKILDRREAIKEALKKAKDLDVVVITGKGSEPWMCLAKGKKIPWDDRQAVREEFLRLQK